MYKARAWLGMLGLECFVEGEKKCLELGVKRGEAWGAYIGDSTSTTKETTEHRHGHDTERIREIHARIEGQRSHRWCGRTMGAPAPLGPPPRLGSRPSACACMVILEMLVLDFYSLGSASDSPRCT
jgi:hypothetical protein